MYISRYTLYWQHINYSHLYLFPIHWPKFRFELKTNRYGLGESKQATVTIPIMSVYENTNGMPMAEGRNLHMQTARGEGKYLCIIYTVDVVIVNVMQWRTWSLRLEQHLGQMLWHHYLTQNPNQ